jgi:DNA-binding HxlR family transcriptional regulator
MFLPGSTMKDAVLESLREGEMSISKLHRHLGSEGYKMHRLVLTGYLKALEDVSVLRAKEIPPSKVYAVPTGGEMSIYETIGALAMSSSKDQAEASRLAVYALQKLFRRPVFREELRLAGFEDEIAAERITGEERNEVKRALAKKGHGVPDNDPAYRVSVADEALEVMCRDVLASALLSKFKAHSLVIETKQTKLG